MNKIRQTASEQKDSEQDVVKKWAQIITYANNNQLDVLEFFEDIAKTYNLEDHTEHIKKEAKNEEEFVPKMFIMMYGHCDWSTKHKLADSLIHAHIRYLNANEMLTDALEAKLRLECSECSNCICCGTKVTKKTGTFIKMSSNDFCDNYCEHKGDLINHKKGCRYFGR